MTAASLIEQALQKGLDEGVFPGASLLILQGDEIYHEASVGLAQLNPERPLLPHHFFDLASLTKPLCTATLFMLATDAGHLHPDETLGEFFPRSPLASLTFKSLLNHSSGLPDWKAYYLELLAANPQWVATSQGRTWLLEQILHEKAKSPEGKKVVYSDLGYILLGSLLEKNYGKTLDEIFQERVATPLGLEYTFFNPILPFKKPRDENPLHFVATEDCLWRKKILSGEVMDDHCYLMGGVAGHAGLYSTVHDLAKWLRELNKARQGESDFIHQKTFDLFTHIPSDRNPNLPFFTLGFDTPSFPSSSGKYFSPSSLGHLGYTGTSFWWDLEKDITVILLTNRVHPSRDNEKIKKFRPLFHDLIRKTLEP